MDYLQELIRKCEVAIQLECEYDCIIDCKTLLSLVIELEQLRRRIEADGSSS